MAGILLIFAYVPTSSGVSTATESYEQLLEAVKSGRFSVDKDKDEAKDVLQQILDKSKYKEHIVLGTKSPYQRQNTQSPLRANKLKNRF